MFKENKNLSRGMTDTLIGAGTEMDGHLKSETGVRIEGVFKGELESKGDIVIGEGGVAKSNITAHDVTIAGKVFGDVHTRGKLIITSTGQLHGNSHAAILNVHEGGILNGSSKMERGRVEGKTIGNDSDHSSDSSGSSGSADKNAKQAG
jgi:cytoskeletal protein CcmA (bactofilin family)